MTTQEWNEHLARMAEYNRKIERNIKVASFFLAISIFNVCIALGLAITALFR